MHLYPVVLFLISITLMSVMMEVSQAARGRSGGGSRGGSSGSRKSSGSKSSSGSGSKTKVGKYDPIKQPQFALLLLSSKLRLVLAQTC